jgi:hypothetical protein
MSQANGDGGAPGHGRSDKAGAKAKARREAKARARWEREAERRVRLCYAVELGGEGHGLSLPEVRTLQTIAVGEKTWTTSAELARVGLNRTTLAGLVAVGWVEEFVLEDGPAVMLSEWAVEALGLDVVEHWEVFSGVAEQEDSSGEKTRMVVREPHEIPRWSTCMPPPEPGMPRPKRVPIKLPFLYRLSKLPEDVIQGLIARTIVDPVVEAMANEEYLLREAREARTEDGRLDIDPETGQVRLEPAEPVTLWATPDDGLKGGVSDPYGGKIPIARPRGRPSKKKKRRRRRSA